MSPEDTTEIVSTRIKYGETIGKAVDGKDLEPKEGFVIEAEVAEETGEKSQREKLYFRRFQGTGDRNSHFALLDKKVKRIWEKVETREGLTEKEVGEVLNLIEWIPGGKEMSEEQLTDQLIEAAVWIYKNTYDTRANLLKAAEAWDKLRLATLVENEDYKPSQAEKDKIMREREEVEGVEDGAKGTDPRVADLYWYCMAHEGDAQTLRLSDILAEQLKEENKNSWLQELVTAEDQRDQNIFKTKIPQRLTERQVREQLAIDAKGYWEGLLLEAMEARLGIGMRSQARARLEEEEDGKVKKVKLVIRATEDEGFEGYQSALAIALVAKDTVIGGFLDSMERGAYWRGKAKLDIAYWSMYMGELIDFSEAIQDSPLIDVFSKIDERLMQAGVRNHTGATAIIQMSKDQKMMDALNVIYRLPNGLGYREALVELNKRPEHNFDPDGELPDYVTDAVMVSQIWGEDAKAMNSKDRRYQIWNFADFYFKRFIKVYGNIVDVLGASFRFTEDNVSKMGFALPRNLWFNYQAMTDDERELDVVEHPDQKDKLWQHYFFYLLQRKHRKLREWVELGYEGSEAIQNLKLGKAGAFSAYNNERLDHRQGVYKRFEETLKEHKDLIIKRNRGKAAWDDALVKKIEQVEKDFEAGASYIIGGEIFNKGEGEIFYNEAVVDLIERHSSGGQLTAEETGLVDRFVNLQGVLQDIRSWGVLYVWDEPEVIKATENKADLMYALEYDIKGAKAKAELLNLLSEAPFKTMEELKVMPKQIIDAVNNMWHRFHPDQVFKQIYKYYLFAEMVVMGRMINMEIPTAQMLDQALDPTGEIQLGWWFLDEKLQELGYFEKLTMVRKRFIDMGLYHAFDKAVAMQLDHLMHDESLDWPHKRSATQEQRAFVYNYVAGYHDPGQPIEHWRLLEATKVVDEKTGAVSYERGGSVVQDMTKYELDGFHPTAKEIKKDPKAVEIEEFFEKISFNESGGINGGSEYNSVITKANSVVKEEANATSIDLAMVAKGEMLGVVERQGGWRKVILRNGQEGWIEHRRVREESEELRHGEIMYEGGRYVWMGTGWGWDQGAWSTVGATQRKVFKPGEGLDRKVLSLKYGKKKKLDKEKTLEQCYPPTYVFKSPEHRDAFMLHRMYMVFRLMFARPADPTEVFIPGESKIELDRYYKPGEGGRPRKASMFQIIRQTQEVVDKIQQVKMIMAAKGMEQKDVGWRFRFGFSSATRLEGAAAVINEHIAGHLAQHHLGMIVEYMKKRDAQLAQFLTIRQRIGIAGATFRPKLSGVPVSPAGVFGGFAGNAIVSLIGTGTAKTAQAVIWRGLGKVFELVVSPGTAIAAAKVLTFALIYWGIGSWWDLKIAKPIIGKIPKKYRAVDYDLFNKYLTYAHEKNKFVPIDLNRD